MTPLRLIPPIHRATHRIGLYLAELREHKLSQGEAHILALLTRSSPTTIAELHKGLAHQRSTLTSILDRLVDREFVSRVTGTHDRRTFVIGLTTEGARVARRVHEHLLALERAVMKKCSAKELDAFIKVVSLVEAEAHRRATGWKSESGVRSQNREVRMKNG